MILRLSSLPRPLTSLLAGVHRIAAFTLLPLVASLSLAQDEPSPIEESPGEKAARYLEALRKRPGSETLFDRFFATWLEEGSVTGLGNFLERQAAAPEATIADRVLLAFFQSRQGEHDQAIATFETALEEDPNQPEALLEKAKLEYRILELEPALRDLEKLAGLDLDPELSIAAGKLKGRVLARGGDGDAALAAWEELAGAHPEDTELLEDLVDLRLDEGMTAEAIAGMESLIAASDDAYDRVSRQMRLGDILVRSGDRERAIEVYDRSLAATGRDTWLEKELLAKYEQAYRAEGDVAGLKNHLVELTEAEPDRLALKKRLAMVQAELGESEAARTTFAEVLKLTPGDRINRETFIDLLGRLGRHEEAAEQMQALASLHPDDPELIAQLAIRQEAAEQPEAAAASVRAYLEKSDGSEYAHLRSARMLEQFGQDDVAGEFYETMVATFPDSGEAKESLAIFLHRTGETEKAVDLWKAIAEAGSGEDAMRAAKALSVRGEREVAFEILRSRIEAFATDFGFLGHYLTEAVANEAWEEALPWAEVRLGLARNSGELNEAIRQMISLLEQSDQAEAWREAHLAKPDRSVAQSCLLAELLEQDSQYGAAEEVLAGHLAAGDLLALTQRVRLYRLRGLWEEAAEAQRKLIDLPEGRRSANLQELVGFLRRALANQEALEWIEEWKKLSPGATQPWLEQASILQGDGKTDEAIDVLQAAARKFDDRDELRAELASLYQEDDRIDDALEIYWSLFDQAENIDQKLTWVGSLSTVARQDGSIDELVKKFEDRRRSHRTSVIPLLAIAEIHRRDYNQEARREILKEAARMRPEDVTLLHQIARIEEEQGNWEVAMETLRTASALDPTKRTRQQMAELELRYGDDEEGYRMILELGGGADRLDADSVLGLADAMVARSGWQRAARFLEPYLTRFPEDYRIAYLRAVALVEDGDLEPARDVFLDLAIWEHEIVKPQMLATTRNSSVESWQGETLPPRLKKLMGFLGYSDAFQYRQQLQQGQINYRVSYGSGSRGARLVNLPANLDAAHQYAIVHLRSLAQSLLDEELAALQAEMEQRGLEEAAIVLHFPFSEQYRSDLPFPVEMLDENPDDLALFAMAVFQQLGPIQGAATSIDDRLMARCYDKLKDGYPEIAFTAAVYAAAAGREEGVALLGKAMEECPLEGDPSGHTRFVIGQAVAGRFPYSETSTITLPPDLRAPLLDLLKQWKQESLEEATRTGSGTLASTFLPYDQIGGALRRDDSPRALIEYLDSEAERFEKARSQLGKSRGSSLVLQQFSWINRDQPLIQPLLFPPLELPDYPGNILIHFVPIPNYGNFSALPSLETLEQIDHATDPVLRVLIAHTGMANDRIHPEIARIVENTEPSDPDALRNFYLAAAWLGSEGEDPAKAIELLESIRRKPMPSETRKRIDGAIVAYAQSIPDRKEDSAATKAGQDAALRLRYGQLPPQHRTELAAALTELGLEMAAEQLNRLNQPSPVTTRSTGMRTVASAPQDLDDRIRQLLEKGDHERAEKLTLQTVEAALKPIANGLSVTSFDYRFLNFVNYVSGEGRLSMAIERELKPTEDAGPNEYFQWAAWEEVRGNLEEALFHYREGTTRLGDRKRPGIDLRVAAILVLTDPEQAGEKLTELPIRDLQGLGNIIQTVRNSTGNRGNQDDEAQFRSRLNQARAFGGLLDSLDDSEIPRTDLSWIDYQSRWTIQEQVFGNDGRFLRGLYYDLNPNRTWELSEEAAKVVASWDTERRQVHQDLCRSMMRSPQLARTAFGWYSAIALQAHEKEEEEATLAELSRLANEVVDVLRDTPRALPAHSTTSYTWLSRQPDSPPWWPEEYLLWQTVRENDRGKADALMTRLRESRVRPMIENAEAIYQLAWGPADEFAATVRRFLNDPNVRDSGSGLQAPLESLAAPRKVFTILKERARIGSLDTDLTSLSLEIAESGTSLGPLLAFQQLRHLVTEGESSAAREFLEKLTVILLGEREKWEDFRSRNPNNSRSFGSPLHTTYAEIMKAACWDTRLAFLVAGFLRENGLDANQQITKGTLLANLGTPRLASDPALASLIFSNAPFLGRAEEFRSLPGAEGTALGQCLGALGNSTKSKELVRSAAAKAGTFGGDLVATYLSGDPKSNVADFLGRHRGTIETELPEAARADLAAFVAEIYGQGGVDYGSVSEDTQAVLQLLGTERAKSQRELAEEFFSIENLPDEFSDIDDVARRLGPMMAPLWAVEDWDLAAELYWHGVALIDRRIARGEWNEYAYTGWNTATRLLIELVTDTPGSGLDRIAFHERIVRGERENKLVPNCGGLNFGPDIRDAFEQAGGFARRDEALDTIAQKLHEQCGEGSLFGMGFHFMEFVFTQPFDRIPELVEWADDRSASDRPWAPMAREFAMGARLGLQSHKNAAIQKAWPRVPEIDSWQPHYRQLLEDEELPLSWRLGMVFEICDSDPHRKLEPETVLLCARLLGDGLLAEAPLHHWTAFYVGTPFNRLEKTPEWEEIAARLHEGWVLANRHNQRPYRQGPAFWPPTESMLAMLNVQLRRGDPEAVKEFFAEPFTYDRLDDETRTFFTLVENGSYERAREILENEFEWYDITDDYVPGNRFEARYSQQLHDRLPDFLETIENPAMRFFAELLLVGALDPKPEDQEADATYPLRGPRIADAAKRFAAVDFGTSGRGTLLRDKSLQQIAAIDGPAGVIWPQWKKWYRPEKARALCSLDNYKKIEHGSRPLAAFAALQLREGDLSVVEDMIASANNSPARDYYRREALEHFTARLIESLMFRKPTAKPQEFAAYSESFGKLISETKNDIFQHSNLDMLVSAHLVATVLAGKEAELSAWREQLDENRAKRRSDAVKGDQNTFLRILVQTLKVKVPNEAIRATPEERLRTLQAVFADPGIRDAFGMPKDLFQRLIEQELLLPEQLLEDGGKRLAEQNPRGGWAAVEIALTHWRKRDFDQAMVWCDRAQEDCGDPEKALERFARVSLKRVDILLAAEKNTEALAALDALGKTIDLKRLPTGLQKTIERLREQAS